MSETYEVAVHLALYEYLLGQASSPARTVVFPNVAAVAPAAAPGAEWLRASMLPAPNFAINIGDTTNQIQGILQVDALVFPGGGEPPVARLAQIVMGWFRRGTELVKDGQRVRIVRAPYRGRMLSDDPWVFIPVSIPYLAFATPA